MVLRRVVLVMLLTGAAVILDSPTAEAGPTQFSLRTPVPATTFGSSTANISVRLYDSEGINPGYLRMALDGTSVCPIVAIDRFWDEEWGEYWEGPSDPDYALLALHGVRAEYYLLDEDELWVVEFEG